MCINQKITFGSQSSLPSLWDPGTELRWSGCVANPVTCDVISKVLVGILILAFPSLPCCLVGWLVDQLLCSMLKTEPEPFFSQAGSLPLSSVSILVVAHFALLLRNLRNDPKQPLVNLQFNLIFMTVTLYIPPTIPGYRIFLLCLVAQMSCVLCELLRSKRNFFCCMCRSGLIQSLEETFLQRPRITPAAQARPLWFPCQPS